jgi:cytochrome c556
LLGLALVLAASLTTAATAADDDDKEIKEAQKDILDLTKTVEGGKKNAAAVNGKVAAIKKKYEELAPLMHIYKPKDKGGLGFGPGPKNGLEMKIRDMSKRALAPAKLKEETAELLRMAYVNIAMAEITKQYFTKPKTGSKGKKDWDKHLADMKKTSLELIDAIKAKDPKMIKKVAADLDSSCDSCHKDFRDD